MIPAVLLLPSAISTRLHFHFLSPVIPSSRCLWRPPSFPTALGQLRPFPSPSPPPSLSPHPHYVSIPPLHQVHISQLGFGLTLRGDLTPRPLTPRCPAEMAKRRCPGPNARAWAR